MNNLLIFNPNFPGVRFETTTNSLKWSETVEEIRTALNEKGLDSSILDTTNAFLADNNTQLNSESTLPSGSLTRIVLSPKKKMDSGNPSYNELRRRAKDLGIIGLGSNPTKDELIDAISEVEEHNPYVDVAEEVESNSNSEVIQRINSYIEAIVENTQKINVELSELTISPEAQAALEIVEKENQQMLDLCATLSVVK